MPTKKNQISKKKKIISLSPQRFLLVYGIKRLYHKKMNPDVPGVVAPLLISFPYFNENSLTLGLKYGHIWRHISVHFFENPRILIKKKRVIIAGDSKLRS